jgi:hypothetical protein
MRQPFFRAFFLVFLLFLLVQAAVTVTYAVNPQLFYYRAWEYFFRWANTTIADDSVWEGKELEDLARRHLFLYQESRQTYVSTDRDGFRSAPADMGPPGILVFGRSNVFGSGVSDDETFAWQLAKLSGIATFNGAHGQLLSVLSRPGLEQVDLVVDLLHERHLAVTGLTRQIYDLKHRDLQPYQPVARQNLSTLQAMYRPLVRPAYWIPNILDRWWQRLQLDLKEYRTWGQRPYMLLGYRDDGKPTDEIIRIMEKRRRIVERLGYRYLAVIIPSRQTVYAPPLVPEGTRERGTRIAAALEQRDFPLVNLFPLFRTESGRDYYFRYDTHWNAQGARVAAELTAARIRSQFPPSSGPGSAQPQQAAQPVGKTR